MASRNDLAGQRFGRLTVIAFTGRRVGSSAVWECLCDCGNRLDVTANRLRTGNTRSCGCLKRDLTSARFTKHGMSQSTEYKMHQHAKERAKKYGVPFSIELDDIVIPERCPCLGIPLETGSGKLHDNSPTLDRLRPELGYVPGNVAVISHLANTIKQNATSAQVLKVADWMDSLGL